MRRGVIDVLRDDVGVATGVAVWGAPGATSDSAVDTLRHTSRLVRALGSRAGTAARVRRALEIRRPAEPHWYPSNIGVLASRRGQGLASTLLRPRLAAVDEVAMPAYLVCTRVENVYL